ncbi:hypothetical protein PILCRDRAFT_64821 [Piloderma croceum F 1598]|uniref:Uncharacterized protein n=1 Tax=Piloderma croceum (strain F 1598) TaxID=765440 RepID=A0A0C3FQU7_PILCF|nr:hypothetical protein PILCRDRAFT_64821 [Piloderma croceum F 1598]
MGKFFDEIPEFLVSWIEEQELFWVGSCPLSPDGHVNISPKGVRGSFHIVNANKVWYQDLTGSGIETISHLRENGRITIMFSAFQGPPRICRLFGTGTVHEFGTPEYDALIPIVDRKPGSRGVIVVDVHKVGTSCGYAVPLYAFQSHRTQLLHYFDKKEDADRKVEAEHRSDDGLKAYWALKNLKSIDGLEGLSVAHTANVTPQSIFDEVEERKPYRASVATQSRQNTDNIMLLAGFSLGIIFSILYVRLVGVV